MSRLLARVIAASLIACAILLTLGVSHAEALVTFRSKNQTIGTGTSPTPTEPAGCASGDALLAFYQSDAGTAPTLPAGWTSLYNGTAGAVTWRVGYIIRGGSAPSYAFTHTGNVYREVHVLCLQGSTTITLDSQSATGTTGNGNHPMNGPSTTAVATTSLAVTGGVAPYSTGSNGGFTAPSGYTLRTDNTSGNDGAMATKSLSAAGAEDPGAFASGVMSGDWWDGFTVTFTDDAGGAPAAAPRLTLLGVG